MARAKATVTQKGGRRFERLTATYRRAKGRYVDIGMMTGSQTDDGTPSAMIAGVHEFGYGDIPARPYLGVSDADAAAILRAIQAALQV